MNTVTTAVQRNKKFVIIVLIAIAIAAAYSFFSLRPASNPDLLRVSGNMDQRGSCR